MQPGGSADTLIKSSGSSLSFSSGDGKFGAGLTITSFFFNVFESSSGRFVNVPTSNPKCTRFSYVFKDITSSAELLHRSGQRLYTMFCPVDSVFDISSSNADVLLTAPKYPSLFVKRLPLEPIFALAFSSSEGSLIAFKQQRQSLPETTGQNPCESEQTLNAVHPNAAGQQRVQF